MKALKLLKCILLGAVACALVPGLVLFWIYGTETHHKNRDSIWWTERGRNLIPPTAADIVLQQDFLDHYAAYTVAENDLQAFLLERFASVYKPQHQIDPARDARPVDASKVGDRIGRLGWEVAEGTLYYGYCASNGGLHEYYHDPATGRTYQESAYW